jgi:predicted kinase
MAAAILHLICGGTGAGKTTYAMRLADEVGAARFAIDEWMSALFWMDSPQPIESEWAMERVDRSARLMWRTAVDVARRGTPCILEPGLTTRADRARYLGLAQQDGVPVRIHYLDVPADERWQRVDARNAEPGATAQLAFQVTREMFDFVEGMWEPPSLEERASGSWIVVQG